MGKTAIELLLEAIEYPEEAEIGATGYVLRVDDAQVEAEEVEGMLRFRRELVDGSPDSASIAATLATYAPGRMLKEEAVLAADRKTRAVYLWQEYPVKKLADLRMYKRYFETFMDSCDWYLARIEDEKSPSPSAFPNLTIRP